MRTTKNEAPGLIRKALGPAAAPVMTHADLALLLRQDFGGKGVAVSARAIPRWLKEGVAPRPAALRSLREVAAMTDEQRLAALVKARAPKRNGRRQ